MTKPFVSVIIPMVDERAYIESCVEACLAQDYPEDRLEVLVVDGGSRDGSVELVRALSARDVRVRLVENPRRIAAAAANEGVAAAKGDVLCFLSAHGVPDAGYVSTSVNVLLETGAAGVGGEYVHEGVDPRSHAIGLAMASPFGMASPHRTASTRQEVDTISHPTFWKSAIVTAGGYDESLHRNEDYELNYRVRQRVGPLVFSPEIRSVYRPRRDLSSLWKQFHAYGIGKGEVLRRHPGALQGRHVVPPLAVLGVASLPVLMAVRTGRVAAAGGLAAYAGVLGLAVVRDAPHRRGASVPTFIASFPVMHLAWGLGLLRSVFTGRGRAR